jgi:hypothetical protein
MGDIRRTVATLPVTHEVQHQLAVKLPLGQDSDAQHLHLGQGQARRFFSSELQPDQKEMGQDHEGHMVMPPAPTAHLILPHPQVLFNILETRLH